MSGSISLSGPAPYGVLGRLIADAGATRARLDQLTTQVASGRMGEAYADLGAGARVSLDLRPAIALQQTWQANIDAASGRMQVTQAAMEQIGQIAADFNAKLNSVNALNPPEIDSIATAARDALRTVAGLLDSKNGDVYVFAGQDTANAPVPGADAILTSGFYTQIAAAVGGLAGAGAPATIAATLGIASSNAPGTSPFSAYLSQPAVILQAAAPTVEIGPQQREPTGVPASANGFALATGTSSTGSYMRDVMRALATIGAMSSSQVNVPGFSALVQDTQTSLRDVVADLATDAGVLGDKQARLQSIRTQLDTTQTAMTGQVSAVEDVDMAATLSRLSLVQTQMQASYQMIAGFTNFSLVKFL